MKYLTVAEYIKRADERTEILQELLAEMEVGSEELAIEEAELDRIIVEKKVEKVMYKHYLQMLDELSEFVDVEESELSVELEEFSIKIR